MQYEFINVAAYELYTSTTILGLPDSLMHKTTAISRHSSKSHCLWPIIL